MWDSLKLLSDATALKAAKLWSDNPTNLKLINNQINCVYRFENKNQGYYLRITHKMIRTQSELEAAIFFQQYLYKNHVHVCPAILSKYSRLIETVKQDHLEFYAHVCLEMPGQPINFSSKNKEAYIAWGQAMAQLHQASTGFDPENHSFLSWHDLWVETGAKVELESPEINQAFNEISQFLNNLTVNKNNFGLIHGDHRVANVLAYRHKISIIDFDEPIYHWYMSDIVRPFLDLANQPYCNWENNWHWYLEGYNQIFPIEKTLLEAANWFVRMKSLSIYLWCKNHWYEPTAPGGKPRDIWLDELKNMVFTPLFQS